MASFDRSYLSSSPVLALPPPQPVHQASFNRSFLPHQSVSMSHSAIWSQFAAENPMLAPRGRKRSRDEAAVNLDPPEKALPAAVLEPEDEWEYGPGMVLIKKKSGYFPGADSQSGTWVEEQAARDNLQKTEAALDAQHEQAQERPSLRSHKSSRLDVMAKLSPTRESSTSRSSPVRDPADSPDTPIPTTGDSNAQPIVDDFTLHLGIGWSRISEDEHIQAAARGWSRFIENHYPINNVKIRLESRGLQSYLVEADEGYFLFAENLRQGRLVSQNPERLLQNLKASPPVFDAPNIMEAAESPKPVEEPAASIPNDTTMTANIPTMVDVQMDMN